MSTPQSRTTSERSDDIPLLLHQLHQLQIAEVIDAHLPAPHGNRQGLSYGQLSELFLSYIMSQADHRFTDTHKIQGTLYAFFGLEDASIPPADVTLIEDALTTHQVDHKIFRYPGADHGFFCDQRASYHPEAAADAWEQVKTLFKTKL